MKTFVITIGCASLVSLPAGTASKDQTFVDEASRGGKMEVELGQLAQRNASSSAVREFGARMVKDHTRLNNELGSVATSIGLTVPTNLLSGQQSEYAKLSKLSGKKFDKEYMDLMVKDHVSDLSAFQKEESSTQDPKLRAAIATAIPVIREHLNMAKSDSGQ